MTLRVLRSNSAAFRRLLTRLRESPLGDARGVDKRVAAIIRDVRRRGDRALIEYTQRFDHIALKPNQLRVGARELEAAAVALTPSQRSALELAARRIRNFHRHTLQRSFEYRDHLGMRLGQIAQPLRRVGIYVPGGEGAYPSSVLMSAIPAKVAGVREIVMVSPAASGRAAVLAAAAMAGVTEVYRVGGAQAIAALAFGTRTIAPVDKIVGPGNAYVQAAKRLVYGVVDIDKIAGPSEVLVIADSSPRPEWVAADLIAQAEHGSGDETAILLTPSAEVARRVASALDRQLEGLPRAAAVSTALARRGAAVIVRDLDEAFALANRIAPEHLELEIRDAARWLPQVQAAGAVFLGAHSPAPLGDYVAGPNHVLPTGGAARFSSPLGAYDFIKRTSIIEASPAAVRRLGPAVARLARMEGFEGHARAMELRLRVRSRVVRKNRDGKEKRKDGQRRSP